MYALIGQLNKIYTKEQRKRDLMAFYVTRKPNKEKIQIIQ